MVRTIIAVLVGFLVALFLMFGLFTVAYLAIGPDGAFRPTTYEITPLWMVTGIVVGLLAAVAGGFVCVGIVRNTRASLILAGVFLVFGLLSAIPHLKAPSEEEQKERPATVGNWEAMQNAKQPTGLTLALPVVWAAGVLLGGRIKGQGPTTPGQGRG